MRPTLGVDQGVHEPAGQRHHLRFPATGRAPVISVFAEERATSGWSACATTASASRPPTGTRLFRRFERGSNTGGISGTGLGLHIVKEIVQGHGGSVSFESRSARARRSGCTCRSNRCRRRTRRSARSPRARPVRSGSSGVLSRDWRRPAAGPVAKRQRPPCVSKAAAASGTSGRDRTFDPRIKNPLLYQLSYGGAVGARTLASGGSCLQAFAATLSSTDRLTEAVSAADSSPRTVRCRVVGIRRTHGGCSSARLEHQVVVLGVAGSNPVSHPISTWFAIVAGLASLRERVARSRGVADGRPGSGRGRPRIFRPLRTR
jgi:hypothetical protein